MNAKRVNWKGYWVAAPTPFTREGALDEAAWRQLLDLYLRQGVHGLLVNGTSGEWFSQTDKERQRVAELAVQQVGGKIPVVIGCTTFTPQHTSELGRHAASIGADGILSTPPPYATPTSREVIAFYQYVAQHVDLPLMVYNWPRGTNIEMSKEMVIELSNIERVVAIKDSTANKAQFLETLTAVADHVLVFGGFVSIQGLAMLQVIGGSGSIDGGGLGATMAVEFYEAYWRGDLSTARNQAERYSQLMRQLINPDWSGVYGSPQAQMKAAMNILGQPGGYPRLPLLPIEDPVALTALRRTLESTGLLRREKVPDALSA